MSDKRKKIAIVIPAFNEAVTIENVVVGLLQKGVPIVVDDGSEYQTADIALRAGAIIIKHHTNLGYDTAIHTGLKKALELNFNFAVVFDADGQHDPKFIDDAMKLFKSGLDMVVGCRDSKQRISESIFGVVSSLFWGVADPLCGLKAYRLSKFNNLVLMNTYKSIGTEILIRAIRNGLEVKSHCTKTSPRQGPSRFGSSLSSNYHILKSLLYGVLFVRAGGR